MIVGSTIVAYLGATQLMAMKPEKFFWLWGSILAFGIVSAMLKAKEGTPVQGEIVDPKTGEIYPVEMRDKSKHFGDILSDLPPINDQTPRR